MQVRGYAIQFGTRKKNSTKNKIKALTKKLGDLEKSVSSQKYEINEIKNKINKTENILWNNEAQILKVRNDIEELVAKNTEGAKFRNKQRWFEGGEKCTKYFLNLEKHKSKK